MMFAGRRSYNDANSSNCSVILGLIALAHSSYLLSSEYNLIYDQVPGWSSSEFSVSPGRLLQFRRIQIRSSGRNQYVDIAHLSYFLPFPMCSPVSGNKFLGRAVNCAKEKEGRDCKEIGKRGKWRKSNFPVFVISLLKVKNKNLENII